MSRWKREQLPELHKQGAKPRLSNGEIVLDDPPADLDALETQVNTDLQVRRRDRAIAGTTDADSIHIRALIELFNKRDNYLTNRIVELQDTLAALKAAGGNANSRLNTLPDSYMATATRPRGAAISDYNADIAAGNVDA